MSPVNLSFSIFVPSELINAKILKNPILINYKQKKRKKKKNQS